MALQDKITINLLPVELTLSKKERSHRLLITRGSISFLVTVVVITAVILFLRIGQTVRLHSLNSKIDSSKNSIQSYKDREGLVTLLKSRLDGINSIIKLDPIQSQAFNLIISLMPEDIDIVEFKADRNGTIGLTGKTSSLYSLKTFFNNLTDSNINQGKITAVKIDSLSQRGENEVRFDLSIQMIGAK